MLKVIGQEEGPKLPHKGPQTSLAAGGRGVWGVEINYDDDDDDDDFENFDDDSDKFSSSQKTSNTICTRRGSDKLR